MVNLNDMALDLDPVENGIWFTYHEDFEMLIASTKNEPYEKALRKQGGSARKGFRTSSTMSDEATNKAIERACVVHCCKGWRNLFDGETEIVYTPEKALEFLLDPKFRNVFDWFWITANDIGEFTADAQRDRAKNSASD